MKHIMDIDLLCCDEELIMLGSPDVNLWSSASSSPSEGGGVGNPYGGAACHHVHQLPPLTPAFATEFDDDDVLKTMDADDAVTVEFLLSKQTEYTSAEHYPSLLQSNDLCIHRALAVRWLVKAHRILNFSPITAVLAVNYLDRYLAKNKCLTWKDWMVELLSIACLSVAAKMEEVDVPSLVDLQVDGLEHIFHGSTVQRMELAVMSSLGWKLRPVTPLAFAEKAISYLDLSNYFKHLLFQRVWELNLGALLEEEFLKFEASAIGVATVFTALEETIPVQAEKMKETLRAYIPLQRDVVENCLRVLEELIVDPDNSKNYGSGTGAGADVAASVFPPSPTGILQRASADIINEVDAANIMRMRSEDMSSSCTTISSSAVAEDPLNKVNIANDYPNHDSCEPAKLSCYSEYISTSASTTSAVPDVFLLIATTTTVVTEDAEEAHHCDELSTGSNTCYMRQGFTTTSSHLCKRQRRF